MSALNDVEKLIQSTAEVIGLQIGVIDSNKTAIIGTGPYRKNLGTIRPNGCYLYRSVSTGESFLIDEPREKENCKECEGRLNCRYSVVLCTPVSSSNQIIGGVVLLGYNSRNQNIVLSENDVWKRYIKELSRWFSKDHIIYNVLKTRSYSEKEIANILNLQKKEGVIITDSNNNIININSLAYDLIGESGKEIFKSNLNEFIPNKYISQLVNEKNETIFFTSNKTNVPLKISVKETSAIGIYDGRAYIIERYSRKRATRNLPQDKQDAFMKMVGSSPAIEELKQVIKKAAPSNLSVLIVGESGTGKELVAEAIHELSLRSAGPFVTLNCAAIPDNLAESELFGYEAGAFTGAMSTGKKGKFEHAQGGTLFLDEIEELSLAIQAKLLRVLEKNEIYHIGGRKPIPVDIRIVAATNMPVEQLILAGRFREDLFYRLNVLPIKVPNLQNRSSDIPELARHFLRQYRNMYKNTVMNDFSLEVLTRFQNYQWPGNIRQLKNVINYLCAMTQQKVAQTTDLPYYLIEGSITNKRLNIGPKKVRNRDVEEALIKFGEDTEGKKRAAEFLGISLPTLYRRIKDIKRVSRNY